MDHDFATAQIAAQHCAELIARGPRPEEREAQIAAWRRDLAGHLAAFIGALFSGDQITAQVGPPEWLSGSEALARIGPVAANSLLRCGAAKIGSAAGHAAGDGAAASVLLSLDHATALALAERSFGGEGRVGEPSLDPLPRSALLMIDEVAMRIAEALGAARLGDGAQGDAMALRGEVILRSENAARLRPFDPAGPAALITVTLTSGQGCEWRAHLALAAAAFDCLLPEACVAEHRPATAAPAATSFGAIPLGMRAVLAEIKLTLSALDRLAPGDMLPLAMPRSVPLQIGEALVGHGTIGTLEDRMALRLTQLSDPSLALPSASSLQQGFSQ